MSNGLMIGRLGVPGTGKSYFLRSAAALGKTAVAITRPSELDGYTSDIETEVFWDEQWLPSLDLFTATGYGKLLRWVNAQLAKPEVKVIGVDTARRRISLSLKQLSSAPASYEPHERKSTDYDFDEEE